MKITRYSLNGPKLKIAILSDIHDKPVFAALDFLKEHKPDVIFMPGDIATGHLTYEAWEKDRRPENIENVWQEPKYALNILIASAQIAPTFVSRGNHEYLWQKADIETVTSTGATVLDNTYVKYEDFIIGGLTSAQKSGHEHLKNPIPDTSWLDDFCKNKGFKILLMHEPQIYNQYLKGRGIDLVISGHAHGGQIQIPFTKNIGLYAPDQGLFPHYTKGWYEEKHLLVSAGLSNTVKYIPRLFNPTELVLLTIDKDK